MRIIFSRKGFDSSAGGAPSPLLNNRPITLPIPSAQATPTSYQDLQAPLPELVTQLSRGRISRSDFCHLDPDLERKRLPRKRLWRGSLGQAGAAQGHLQNQAVGCGDLFLFWGLFQAASLTADSSHWQFQGPRLQGVFGWLQVEEVIPVVDRAEIKKQYPWLAQHPHLVGRWPENNCIYLAKRKLCLPEISSDIPGWGTLQRLYPLTAADSKLISLWRIPDWLNPKIQDAFGKPGLGMTYHPPHRWQSNGTLRSAARGQEFVIQLPPCGSQSRAAHSWLKHLLLEFR